MAVSGSAVLITGASGSIGSRLAHEYLRGTDYHIVALVRGRDDEHARLRMCAALRFWGTPLEDFEARVTVLRGDVCSDGLGLSKKERNTLRESVRLVVHAASSLRLDMSKQEARRTILAGTKNVWELAGCCSHVERFGFVSTLEIAGSSNALLEEEFGAAEGRDFLNTYELAKAETETFLRAQSEHGPPLTIFRPSMVVGESTTGRALHFQSFYLLLEKMLLAPDFRVLPHGCPVDTIPVDVLAQAMCRLMEHPSAAGQVYHLCQGLADPMPFRDFVDYMRPLLEARLDRRLPRALYVTPRVHDVLFRAVEPITRGALRRFIATQRMFLKFMQTEWHFANRKTRAVLQSVGLDQPACRDYLPILTDYYLERRSKERLPF